MEVTRPEGDSVRGGQGRGERQLHDRSKRLSSLDYICSKAGQDSRYISKKPDSIRHDAPAMLQ